MAQDSATTTAYWKGQAMASKKVHCWESKMASTKEIVLEHSKEPATVFYLELPKEYETGFQMVQTMVQPMAHDSASSKASQKGKVTAS